MPISQQSVSPGSAAISDEQYAAFIGDNLPYYAPRFDQFKLLGGNFSVSWNWAAFFFPQLWLFFRKMYLFGVIALLATVVFPLIGWLAAGIAVGVAGNHWYYWHATKKLQSLQFTTAEENRLAAARLMGGTSWLIPGIAIAIDVLSILVIRAIFAGLFHAFH